MIPKFRAWDRLRKRISVVDRIYFDTEGVQGALHLYLTDAFLKVFWLLPSHFY